MSFLSCLTLPLRVIQKHYRLAPPYVLSSLFGRRGPVMFHQATIPNTTQNSLSGQVIVKVPYYSTDLLACHLLSTFSIFLLFLVLFNSLA